MDNFFDLIFGGDSSTLAILGGGLTLLLLLALVLILRKRSSAARARRHAMERIKHQSTVMGAIPTSGAETKTAEVFTESAASSDQIEVNEVDPLAEVSIYLEYGYYERAAETLRWFVEEAGQADLPVLRKLLEIYLQLGQMDDYADILERLCQAEDRPDFLRQAVAAGLKEDYDNLQIRVVAETYLQLGMEDIEALVGPRVEEAAAKPAEVKEKEPEALDLAERKAHEQVAEPRPATSAPSVATRPKLTLVKGKQGILPLTDEEKFVLRAFASPSLEAKLHLVTNNREEALVALRRAISAQPKAITHYADTLKLLYFKRNIDDYSRTLWQLYLVLGNVGRDLKERLLGVGFALGHHPVLEALAQVKEPRQIEAIGKEHQLFPIEPAVAKKQPLIQASEAAGLFTMTGHAQDAVLAEVDAYLEYGQLDEALALLEKSVLEDPHHVQLYLPLLDLYDRMDALERFTRLASEIKKKVQRPPDEVVPLMTQLYQRLNQRRQEAA